MFPIKDSIRIPFAPIVTYALILINTLVFLYQSSLSQSEAQAFAAEFALIPRRYFDPAWAGYVGLSGTDYFPFVSGTFMHGGWWHLILNMWTLFIFGSSLEGRVGRWQFLCFYLLCGVTASYVHAWFNQLSDVPTLGASGAIAGVLGGYATTFPRARLTILILIVVIPLFFKVPALFYALVWFGFQFAQGFIDLGSNTGGGIAWWAHIGGFAAGVALIPLWRFAPDRTYDEAQPRFLPPVANAPPWKPGPWG
ncbi:rhomboid family intramembrane serine protease [Rhodomicrobium sp. Az07]|uniref:rhomboid family intramembrane serine protease n=1 Tax=Rhodomicrobium sp. Az07 TaxID=2839034 RepID=UPI001BECE5AE|nr:rhomboid family intramembrane serine protease [Rhodomicrobium sp. Az07]MBT3070007.1 rhomboid family intramembrane serine protease [Rhodomicrobium sp. Az07]